MEYKIEPVIENTITHYQLNKKRCLLLSCFDKTKQYLNMPTLGVNTVFQFFKDINKENVLDIKDRKYKILRLTYTVFMIGIIVSVGSFAISFYLQGR